MSLEQHSIDQGYKARLGNLEVAPPAHAWAAIAAQLPNEKADEKGIWFWGTGSSASMTAEEKSKRERIIFWWWTGALVALAAISMLAYFGLPATTTNNSPTPTPPPSAAALVPIAAASNPENGEYFTATTEEEECPEVATTSSNTSISATSKTGVVNATTPMESARIPATSQKSAPAPNVIQPADFVTPNTISSTPTLPQGSALTDTKTSASPVSETNPIGLSMASLSMNQLQLADLSLLETEPTKLPFGPGVGCPDFNNSASWNFAVRVFAGPGNIFQAYTSTDQTASYAELRDSIENRQLSVHAGLRFEAVNELGLFVRAGADYQMYRTNVEYLGPPSSRTVIDSVFMEDTQTWRVETRNETVQELRNVYNRQHAIVLTGGVGFRKTFGNVSPYIMAEAGYEFLFKRRGAFVLPDGNFVDLAEDDQGLYINDRPGFQFGGVIGIDFALTDRIEAGISGHYKRLGGIRGSADLLDYDQSTAFGALNLRYTIR